MQLTGMHCICYNQGEMHIVMNLVTYKQCQKFVIKFNKDIAHLMERLIGYKR